MKNSYLPPLIFLFLFFLQACTAIRATFIEWFGETKPVAQIAIPQHENQEGFTSGDFYSPTFEGLDIQRTKIPIRLRSVATGFQLTTDIQFIPSRSDQALIALKSGELYWVDFESKRKTLVQKFDVATSSELGLLGVAFHPQFPKVSKLYVHINPAGKEKPYESQILEYSWNESETGFKLDTPRLLLKLSQPYANHNGGQIQFGPDGKLYIGFGDGGWRDDPHNNGQNLETWLGKILRISVDPSSQNQYSVPEDNPFVSSSAKTLPEIWAFGLRNPWRFSFAPDGRLIVADVGQNSFEEISIVGRGENLGWKVWEGDSCFEKSKECQKLKTKKPFITYGREDGMSITGGLVSENSSVSQLNGKYVFADFVAGRLWAVTLPSLEEEGKTKPSSEMIALGKFPMQFSCFAKGPDGQILVADFGSGAIFEITP